MVVLKPDKFQIPAYSVMDREENIWIADYWDSKILKYNREGDVVLDLASKGHGPGELLKPNGLCLVDGQTKLLVKPSRGYLQLYDAGTGRFIKKMNFRATVQRLLPYKGNQFFMVMGIIGQNPHAFHVVDLDEQIHESWFEMAWMRTYLQMRHHQTALFLHAGFDKKGQLYFSDDYYPSVWVYQKGRPEPIEWKLKQPKFFKEVPKPLSSLEGMNEAMSEAWFNSFTHLYTFFMDAKYLVADWQINESVSHGIDVYDLESRALLLRNAVVPGHVVSAQNGRVYVLELKMSDRAEVDDLYRLHTYRLTGVE